MTKTYSEGCTPTSVEGQLCFLINHVRGTVSHISKPAFDLAEVTVTHVGNKLSQPVLFWDRVPQSVDLGPFDG